MSGPKLNREAWLENTISGFVVPLIRSRTGLSPLKSIKVSVGFPPSGGRNRSTTGKPGTVGVCMTSGRHKHAHIFIHPAYDKDAVLSDYGVMGTVIHETLHACLPEKVGHRKEFSQAASKIGLEGKPTSTTLGDELRKLCQEWVEDLGDYPHDEGVDAGGGGKQGTRMKKCMCPLCGYIAYTTRKWLDAAGGPVCPQDSIEMLEGDDLDDEIDSPLGNPTHQTIEYPVKATPEQKADFKAVGVKRVWDDRWFIRMNRHAAGRGMVTDWWIVDYGERTKVVTDPVTKAKSQMAILDVGEPRLTHAESREDAISVMEALRDNTMTYAEVNEYKRVDDGSDISDEEWGIDDPRLDDLDNPDEDRWEDDEETVDSPESDTDPRFPWEIAKGIPADSIDPDAEKAKREAWVGQEREAPEVADPSERDFDILVAEREKELNRQFGKKGRRR